LTKNKLKIRLEGGEKVGRPLAGTKESFPKREALEISFSFWELIGENG